MSSSLYCLLVLLSLSMAAAGTQFRVGGSGNWTVLGSSAVTYNQWAEKNRFHVGDSIGFMYLPDKDSVMLVDADAYNSCNTSGPIDEFNDGNTVFTFFRSGAFHFISGNKDNCGKNEKLVVVVMAGRNSNSSSPAAAPLPTSENSPPPPSEETAGGGEPSPSPSAASPKAAGVIGALGAVIGALSCVF